MTAVRSNIKGMTVFNTKQTDTTKGQMFFGPPLGVQRYDKFKLTKCKGASERDIKANTFKDVNIGNCTIKFSF